MNEKLFRREIFGRQYKNRGRFNFPWRRTRDPYRILVSEVMLQQTQILRVIPKYNEWMKKFPTVQTLARAPFPKILRIWQGLGYNRRARFLKDIALIAVDKNGGRIPQKASELEKLPGVGRYTARATVCFSSGFCEPFIETNIRRVYIHFFFTWNYPNVLKNTRIDDGIILKRVSETMPMRDRRKWFLALMDYGREALGTSRDNPNRRSKRYMRQSRFKGSRRYVRAKLLRMISGAQSGVSVRVLKRAVLADVDARVHYGAVEDLLAGLADENIIREHNGIWTICRI